MIAEVVPSAYDAVGRQVSQPFRRRKGPHPTFPMGRYVSQALTVECKNLDDLRKFLIGCKPDSDKELFGKDDYWQPPDQFEELKKGDCEDFALWTWRQLLQMGYDARFIGGRCGRYGEGHAWVEFFNDGKCFLLEPMYRRVGPSMPRLCTLRYRPTHSVSWDGKALRYFVHKKPETPIGWRVLAPLIPEYLVFWSQFWFLNSFRIPRAAWHLARQSIFSKRLWSTKKK